MCLTVKPSLHVVQVFGFCVDAPDGKWRIVMELCSHGGLQRYIRQLPADQV